MEFLEYEDSSDSDNESATASHPTRCHQVSSDSVSTTEATNTNTNKPSFAWQDSESSDDDSIDSKDQGNDISDRDTLNTTGKKSSDDAALPSAADLLDDTRGSGSHAIPSFMQHCYVEPIKLQTKTLQRYHSVCIAQSWWRGACAYLSPCSQEPSMLICLLASIMKSNLSFPT
jgi:hypothetical protein